MNNVKEHIIFTNKRGAEVRFDAVSIEGLGGVGSDVQSQKSPYQDGLTYIDSMLEPRYIDVEFIIRGERYREVRSKRGSITSALNPKLGLGTIVYESDRIRRELLAIPESVPYFPDKENRGKRWQRGTVTFIAPNPYWRSPNETTKPLVAYEGGFTLPFTLPFTLGRSGSKTVLYNDGDVPAPMRIEIHGPTTNPQIFNRTTGEHIRINRTVAEGEVMRINTESGRQRITVTDENGNETNAFGYLDSESSILSQFNLELGENEIEHVADAGNRHAEVYVRWDSLYVGV